MYIPHGPRWRERRENPHTPCGPRGTCWVCLAELTPENVLFDDDPDVWLSFCSIACVLDYWKYSKGKYQPYRANII